MHRHHRNSSPAPGWVALREPSSSEDEEDARDEMDDQSSDGDNAVNSTSAAQTQRHTSSRSIVQKAPPRKRKDSSSSSSEREKRRKRARLDQELANRVGGERRGGVSGSGEVGSSARNAGPSRMLNPNGATKSKPTSSPGGTRPSASSASASASRPLPSRPAPSTFAKGNQTASSSYKPISSISSSSAHVKEQKSKLSDFFKGPSYKAGLSTATASKKPALSGLQKDGDIIDLTLDGDDSPPPPTKPKPRRKPKPRASLPNEVVDMSDEEREAASSSSIHQRPRGQMKKSTGNIGKSKSAAVNEDEVIVVSSSEEENKRLSFSGRLPASMRKSMPEPPVAGPSLLQNPISQATAPATQDPKPPIKALVNANTSTERTHPELLTRRPLGVGLLSTLSTAHVSAPFSTQAVRPSQTIDKGLSALASSFKVMDKDKDDNRMNVDVPPTPADPISSKTHRMTASQDGKPPSTSKLVSSPKEELVQQGYNQDVQVDLVPPPAGGPSTRPKTPISPSRMVVGPATHKRVHSASSSSATAIATMSEPPSPLKVHKTSSSLDAKSHERRASQQMKPQAMKVVDQTRASITAPLSPTTPTASMSRRRAPSSSNATPTAFRSQPLPKPPSQTQSRPLPTPRRLQVAVKSTGGVKPRWPRRHSSTSSSPDESDSDSNSDTDRKGKEEERNKPSSPPPRVAATPPPPAPAAAAGSGVDGIDMRDLDHALGVSEPTAPSPTQEQPKNPELPTHVKEQPISSQISKASVHPPRMARKSTGGRGISALPEVIMSAMQLNHDRLRQRRAPQVGGTSAAGAGAGSKSVKPPEVIDLTLDSDEEPEKAQTSFYSVLLLMAICRLRRCLLHLLYLPRLLQRLGIRLSYQMCHRRLSSLPLLPPHLQL
ncbi:hypothetical protein CPB84DRAFT_212878 [Gymnopilus junonius]|uniref:Uncharacterized protein n=1 Tax=Gymnopilus junonius TaxID=109634 RepID=A0A9P5TS96_GYMJU|nr:hypothetical protein CPB84DRAFT_212878 [Gymnopilus junonius]